MLMVHMHWSNQVTPRQNVWTVQWSVCPLLLFGLLGSDNKNNNKAFRECILKTAPQIDVIGAKGVSTQDATIIITLAY